MEFRTTLQDAVFAHLELSDHTVEKSGITPVRGTVRVNLSGVIMLISKNIHFSIVGPVKGWEFSILTIWARVNPHHTLHVWAPQRLIYQKILYSLLLSEIKAEAIEKDYPRGIAQLKRSIWDKIDSFFGENRDINNLDIMHSVFSDGVKKEFLTQWNKTNHILDQIERSISKALIHRSLDNFDGPTDKFIRYTLGFDNTLITERFIGLHHHFKLGGTYIDKGLLPKMDPELFQKSSNLLNPISGMAAGDGREKQIERAVIRALLEKMFADGTISDPDPYFETYDKDLPKKAFALIKSIIKQSNIGDVFNKLEEYELTDHTSNKLFFSKEANFEDNIIHGSLYDSLKPIMVTSRTKNPVIILQLDELCFIHNTVEGLKKSKINTKELTAKIKEYLNQFYREKTISVSSDDINKVAIMATNLLYDPGKDDYQLIAQLGYQAFERLKNYQIKIKPTIKLTDDFSANNPFYNRKPYTPDIVQSVIVRQKPYEKLIMIHVSDNQIDMIDSLKKCRKVYDNYRTEDSSVLFNAVNVDSTERKKLETIKGARITNIGEDTKVIITGNLHFFDTKLNAISPLYTRYLVEKLSTVLRMVIPRHTTVQNITFLFDNSAQDIPGSEGLLDIRQKDYVVPEVLRELAKESIRAHSAVAVREPMSAGAPQQTTGRDPDKPSTSRDTPYPELNRIVFTLNDDDTIKYKARFGLASIDPESQLTYARPEGECTGTIATGKIVDVLSQDESFVNLEEDSIKALDKIPFIGANPEGHSSSQRLEGEHYNEMGDDFNDPRKDARDYKLQFNFQAAISHGLWENNGNKKVAFVNPDHRKTDRLSDSLYLAEHSSSYSEWLARYKRRFPEAHEVDLLEREMDKFKSEEAKVKAFETLKRRIQAKSYDIHTVDPLTVEGAARLNGRYKNDFDNIDFLTVELPGPCNRPRRSADTNSCVTRRKELANALRLLSGSDTQLYLGDDNDKTDIALLKTSNEGERWLQDFFTRFRRLEGKDALAHTRGIHSVIALDDASFDFAQRQIKKGTLSGQPLLLKATPSASYVLLTPAGRVQSAIAGGEGNQVTVLGRPARLIAHALTTLVEFTPDCRIATLTVGDLASSSQPRGIKALNALKTFMTRSPTDGKPLVGELIIEPRSRSAHVFKRLVKDIERLMPKDRPAIETLVLRSPATRQPEYRLLPGETTVLMSPRPSDAKISPHYLPPGHPSVPVQPRTEDSLSGVASERGEFRQRLLEFDTALRDVKAGHSLPDSMVPRLDTLHRRGRGWRMDFLEPDTQARKNIRFTSGAFERFRSFLQGPDHQGFRVKGKKTSAGGLKKAGRFMPLLGSGVPLASLNLTVNEYEKEQDPEVNKLMKSRVIFESVDTANSTTSEFTGRYGVFIDSFMHHVREVFNGYYKEQLEELASKGLRDAPTKTTQIFDLIHAQLDPESFLANNQTLNALMSGDGKNLLTLNIQSINLAKQTLTYGGGYSFQTTLIAGKKDDWKPCKDESVILNYFKPYCASDINRIEYSPDTFNLINDALTTLCRTESRLTGYQCSDGVFHNLRQMTGKMIILMPSVPPWKVKLRYTPLENILSRSALDSSSPGLKLLDAVSDSKLKWLYHKIVKDIRYTELERRGSTYVRSDHFSYDHKYLGQMLTSTDGLKFRPSTSSLYLDSHNHLVVFRQVSDEFSRLLGYDLYSPAEGAGKTYVLMSNGNHLIRVHPRGQTSTWVLNYDGRLPYACINGWGGGVERCSSGPTDNQTWTLTLGETRFQFPNPTPDAPYRVIAQDPNTQFEWLPDRKVIHRLYDTGELNHSSLRAIKLEGIMINYTGASRFLPLELKDCDASPRIRARCMAVAPEQWLTSGFVPKKPKLWAMAGAIDPLPMKADPPPRVEQNPAWLQHKQDCDRQVNEYLKKPYRCFPDKLGLAEADWDQLDRIRLWYDTHHSTVIPLVAPSDDQVEPLQGGPDTGYYFFDSANGQVLLQTTGVLNRDISHFHELEVSKHGALFGNHVSKTVPNKDESQLLVFDAPYYYLLTASPAGQLAHQVIAAETLDGQLSVPPTPPAATPDTTTSDEELIPLRMVNKYDSPSILGTGFYDGATRTYIAFLSSLLDGGLLINKDDGSRFRQINEPVQKTLREEHLPVRKVVQGRTVYYLLFSQHSGNLYYITTVVKNTKSVQRLSSGFQVIRPAGERRSPAQMADNRIFARVQARSGGLLADTLSGYRLWIPDQAWDNTRVVSENLSVESGPFEHWEVKATGQTVAKSNETLSVRQFTPQSGVVMDSLNLGQIVNQVFTKVTLRHPGTAWTTASARAFIGGLKEQLRTLVAEARKQFSATVGLVPLRPITPMTDHPLLSAIRQLDCWYFPGHDTLLAANTRDRFKVMVNDDGQLLALSDTRKQEAFEFFPQPDQGAKGHPFCGKAAAVPLTGVPNEFNTLISGPCSYTLPYLPYDTQLRGSYQWQASAQAWRVQTQQAQYLANRERLALVALDLSRMGPRKASNSRMFRTRQDFNHGMRSLPRDIRERIDTGLIDLRLRPGYLPTQTAWIDYRGRFPAQQRLLFGLPDKGHSVQQLIGQTSAIMKDHHWYWFRHSAATVVYSKDQQTLYRVNLRGYQSLGTFNGVAVMAEGLLLSGTPGADKIKLETLRLDTYYQEQEHQVAFVRNGTRQRFGIMVEGQGGSDVIKLDETDLSFFARILIHPGLAEESITKHDRAQTRIELNVSAFLFLAWRRGQNLVLSNRFTTGDAEIEIQQVWARQHDQFLQPTTLVFNDLELSLSDLAARVTDSGQGVVLPLTVSSLVRKERLRFINATASNPLYIQQDQPVKIVTYQAMDGIKLTVEPLNATYVRRQVFITGTGQWGWEPGSVQVSGPKPDSGYQSWPFLPSVISSSAIGNRTARLWGNSRSNILYLGADARQWSLRGWGGHDLLLLGTSGNTAPRPEVLANRGDQCDNRRLDTPGNSSLWQAILDWTRPLVGGVGNDVYDLRACRPARTIDSRGKHYVLLSSGSKADLRRLSGDNSTALFFTDLTPEQVAFSQCNPQAQSNLTHSNHSLPLDSQTFRIINTRNNQTLALVKPDVLASLHFKGGQVSLNPMAMINRNDSTSAMDDSDGGENEAVTFLNKIIRRGQRLVNYLCSLAGGEKGDIESESERPLGTSLNDTELYQHYQRLVQDLSALSGNHSSESPSFITSASQGMTQNLTTPLNLTLINRG